MAVISIVMYHDKTPWKLANYEEACGFLSLEHKNVLFPSPRSYSAIAALTCTMYHRCSDKNRFNFQDSLGFRGFQS
jgi:hypothetical protein